MSTISVLELQRIRVRDTAKKRRTHPLQGSQQGKGHAGPSNLSVTGWSRRWATQQFRSVRS